MPYLLTVFLSLSLNYLLTLIRICIYCSVQGCGGSQQKMRKFRCFKFPSQDLFEYLVWGSNHNSYILFLKVRESFFEEVIAKLDYSALSNLRCEISGVFLLSFPQNERKIYWFCSVSFAQFVYFLRKVCLLFNF